MGMTCSAKCPCGVDEEVLAGSGEIEGSARLPAWCECCQRLATASTRPGGPRCKKCNAAVHLIEIFQSGPWREEIPTEPIRCPRCGKQTLRLEITGLWD